MFFRILKKFKKIKNEFVRFLKKKICIFQNTK
jgi:hypothetical protein